MARHRQARGLPGGAGRPRTGNRPLTAIPILTIQPLDRRGGPSIIHRDLLDHLDERFEPHVVLSERHEMQADFAAVAAGVHVLPDLPTVPRTLDPITLARYALRARRLGAEIAAIGERVAARLVYTVSEAFPAGALAARRLAVPAVAHVLGMSVFDPPWLGAVWTRVLRRTSDHLIACQHEIAALLTRGGVSPDRMTVVYNAIDVAGVQARATAPGPDLAGRPAIGTVAGMDRRKGHLALLRAASTVVADLPDAHFYVIGDAEGPDRAYRDEVVAEVARLGLDQRFHLVGAVDDVVPWVRALDVYVIPSLTEAMSVAGVEAMALGRPVVATDVGGNPVIVAGGETGLLARPQDPDDLAAKILELGKDCELRERMGEAAAGRAQERFDIRPNAALLSDALASLVR